MTIMMTAKPDHYPRARPSAVTDPKADSRAWPTVFPVTPVWGLVQTRPGWERKVRVGLLQHLGEARVADVYVPLETLWRRVTGGKRKVPHARPLIPGYVFAVLDVFDLPAIHGIEGAVRMVRVAGRQIAVPDAFVTRLRAEEEAGRFDKTRSARLAKGAQRKVGDRVEIADGPFKGFIGTVQRLPNNRRVAVMLALFGRPVEIDADSTMLVEADLAVAR